MSLFGENMPASQEPRVADRIGGSRGEGGLARGRILAIALVLGLLPSIAQAEEPKVPDPATARRSDPWRLVYSLRARQDVRLRLGEVTRPRLAVECDGAQARLTFELAELRSGSSRAAGPLTGHLLVLEASGDSLRSRFEAGFTWPPGQRPGVYTIPDSSAWMRALGGASGFTLLPDSTGPVTSPVEFDLAVVGPWREPSERCASAPTLQASPPGTGAPRRPAYGEYVAVDELPQAISKPRTRYPDALRGSGVEGTVVVQGLVDTDGRVVDCRVVKSNPNFDAAAVEAARQYRFKPAIAEGVPVAVWVAIPMRFVAE